ncbi:hypothetical protein HUN92_22395 [Bacillus firmus]|uniref:hypothetical protein n=1 Tax=Cytobacillus firmus TaxID=1399 RepID=UPI00157FFF7D|nr:hypothetical protein [Cytobacillus firmus]NUH86390.1 hypothetical protein [Cytobacillus firmus]
MFDRKLLNESIEKRIEYFERIVVNHPKMKKALNDIEDYLAVADTNNILLVCGPSGVGKTTAFCNLVKRCDRQVE